MNIAKASRCLPGRGKRNKKISKWSGLLFRLMDKNVERETLGERGLLLQKEQQRRVLHWQGGRGGTGEGEEGASHPLLFP